MIFFNIHFFLLLFLIKYTDFHLFYVTHKKKKIKKKSVDDRT